MDLLTALLTSTITMAVPLLLAALGEVIAERAGIINVGVEGMILVGALAAMLGAYFTGVPELGFLAALVCGALLGALLGWFVVGVGANQVVAGTAVNLLAVGITGVAYRAAFGVTGSALTIEGSRPVALPLLGNLPILGPSLFTQTPLGYAALLLVPVASWFLWQSLPGLKLRMVGENPWAAATQGVAVARVRMLALIVCGILAAAGGAFLVLAYAKTFVEGMSAGRGFIALAIVIVGRWSPFGILCAALLFGLASALQFHFQALGLQIPYQFFLMLPYLLTLLVLAAYSARTRAPAALGQSVPRAG